MIKKIIKLNNLITMSIVFIMLVGAVIPSVTADSNINVKGFTKGIPYQPFKPLKKVTFVNFDKNSMIDDYAYLASIPASVFSNDGTLFSSPLLFFQPKDAYPAEDKYRFLNDYSGTQYLMEDWMSYCDGELDKLTTINVPENNLDESWNAKESTLIKSDDPFDVASKIALNDWSYADKAVVAVIEKDYEKPADKISNSVTGSVSGDIHTESLEVKRSEGCAPEYQQFTVGEEYKYLRAHLWFPAIYINTPLLGILTFPTVTIPSVDPDLQVYCSYDGDWLQTNAASELTISNGPEETCFSYVYKSGTWKVGVTNMPTKGENGDSVAHYLFGKANGKFLFFGNTLDAIMNALGRPITSYNCDITMYPGTEIKISDTPPFGCRNATFKLIWNNPSINLSLSIIGPTGEELESSTEGVSDSREIHLDQLGECLPGEYYKAVVYTMSDISTPVDFKVEYSWGQNISKKEGDCIASACEGAILASVLNAPMLYTSPSSVPTCTIDTLYKLGVKELYVVDLGGYLSKDAMRQLSDIAKINEHFIEYKSIYDSIMSKTGSNDVIFSTIDPWSYWYYDENASGLKPAGEFEGAFFFGPAAYAAAYHGSPLLLVDNHPELSGAVMWHNEFWKKHAATGLTVPPIAPMVLTGRKVYDFLGKYGFDKEGNETMLTVADQYDIGPTWSRVFAGVANPGDIIGTPVDTTNWISRCIFYPALIFENPALQGEVELENGSISERIQPTLLHPFQRLMERLHYPYGSNLKIIRSSQVEKYTYPVLHTYDCYVWRFNERGSKYWGTVYQTREGIIPGQTLSFNEIDQGTREKYEGISGCFVPDLNQPYITSFYASKAGYGNVFSTNFNVTIGNLNKGVITWYESMHGAAFGAGCLAWYSPTSVEEETGSWFLQNFFATIFGLYPLKGETNPWIGYDQLWGSTAEPDSAAMNTEVGLILGWLGLANRNGPLHGGIIKIGLDVVPTNIPLLKFNRKNYFDGLVGAAGIAPFITKSHFAYNANVVDDKLENLHSMTINAGSCLIACKYLQIAMMRHGSVSQEMDPWPTSYWSALPFEQAPRDIALGETIGEIYSKGRVSIGIKYLFEKNEEVSWWWDNAENTILFTDPKLRIYCPSIEYSDNNHWEQSDIQPLRYSVEVSIDGHMPFGVTSYPNEKKPVVFWQQYLWLIGAFIVIVLVAVLIVYLYHKRKK